MHLYVYLYFGRCIDTSSAHPDATNSMYSVRYKAAYFNSEINID